jgi:omega-amidase
MNVKVGICQIKISKNKQENYKTVENAIQEVVEKGAKIIVLPECWNSPYGTENFKDYAEYVYDFNENTTIFMSKIAKKYKIYLIGGSIPTYEIKTKTEYYNTCICYNPEGNRIGTYHKIHLFDINIKDKIKFSESDVLSPGNSPCLLHTEYGKIGIGICYDLRFPRLADIYSTMKADILIYPGAFSIYTGEMHWTLLQKSRALDNQVHVITCSPARDMEAKYKAYGHSSVISPWGKVIYEADESPQNFVIELQDQDKISVREQINILKHRKNL